MNLYFLALLPLTASSPLLPARPLAVQEAAASQASDVHDKVQVALRSASIEFTAGRPAAEVEATLERAATLLLPFIKDGQLAAKERLAAQDVWALREKLVTRYPEASQANSETWRAFAKAIGRHAEAEPKPLATDIDEKVYQALKAGDMTFVGQLGGRAVPGLLRFLKDQPSTSYGNVADDPLLYLIKSDPIAADRFVANLRAKGDVDKLWKIRFARAIERSRIFYREEVWKTQTFFDDETRVPALLDWCDDLLATPECEGNAGEAMRRVVYRHVYPEGLRKRLQEALASDLKAPEYMNAWFAGSHPHEPLRELMLKGLAATNDSAASLARGVLYRMGTNEGIYEELLKQPKARRRYAAQWLHQRSVAQRAAPGSARPTENVPWTPDYGPAEERLIDQLLNDPDADVRAETLGLLMSVPAATYTIQIPAWPKAQLPGEALSQRRFPIAISDETLLRLASDPSVEVRRRLASFSSNVTATQRALLAHRFAEDEDRTVRLRATDLARSFSWIEDVDAAIEATEKLGDILGSDHVDALLFRRSQNDHHSRMDHALRSKRCYAAIAEWVLAKGSVDGARFLLRHPSYLTLRKQAAAGSPAVWTKLLVLSAETGTREIMESWLDELRDDASRLAAIGEAAAGTVDDPETLALLLGSPPSPEAGLNDVIAVNAWMHLFRMKKWDPRLNRDSSPLARELAQSLQRYPKSTREALSRRLVLDESTPAGLAGQVVGRMPGAVPVTEEVVRVAVQSTGTDIEDIHLIRAVVTWMAGRPEGANLGWIERLTQRKDTVSDALKTIQNLRDPRLLPPVAKIIEGPPTAPAYSDAVRALGGFLSDDAAELLLLAARKSGREADRTFCLEQLEKIAALQDAEARWATRRVGAHTREATISKLLALLTDTSTAVRVEAIRGLATWEAVEAMPQLIEFLGDPDEAISAAARAALDRLNAPTKGD